MSALDDLKDRIDSAIYTNTEQNITGDGLQTVLDDMVDTMGVSVSQNSQTGKTELLIGDTPALIVDNEPEAGSDNVVKSGGVIDYLNKYDYLIPLSKYSKYPGIINDNDKWTSLSTTSHILIPIKGKTNIHFDVRRASTGYVRYAFLESTEVVDGETPNFVSGDATLHAFNIEIITKDVVNTYDAEYLYIGNENLENIDLTVDGKNYTLGNVQEINVRVTALENENFGHRISELNGYTQGINDTLFAPLTNYHLYSGKISPSDKWTELSTASHILVLIKGKINIHFDVTRASSGQVYYAFLNSNNVKENTTPDFVSGDATLHSFSIEIITKDVINANDANYLYIENNENLSKIDLTIDGIDYTNGIINTTDDNIDGLDDRVTALENAPTPVYDAYTKAESDTKYATKTSLGNTDAQVGNLADVVSRMVESTTPYSQINKFVNAADYGFLPNETATNNVNALNNALYGGNKTVVITQAGTYKLNDTILLYDNTELICAKGVVLQRDANYGNGIMNVGAGTRTLNQNITIRGLVFDSNNKTVTRSPWSSPLSGTGAGILLYHVKDVKLYDVTCINNSWQGIELCSWENVLIDGFYVESEGDCIHVNRGKNLICRNGFVESYDDGITLLASDWVASAPEIGDIDGVLFENIVDVYNSRQTTTYLSRHLVGRMIEWQSGMDVQYGDAVISNGHLYRCTGEVVNGVATHYISTVAPTFDSTTGAATLADGVSWRYNQDDAPNSCNIYNVTYRHIICNRARPFIMAGYNVGNGYDRSLHPLAIAAGLYPEIKGILVDDVVKPDTNPLVQMMGNTSVEMRCTNIKYEYTFTNIKKCAGYIFAGYNNTDYGHIQIDKCNFISSKGVRFGEGAMVYIKDCIVDSNGIRTFDADDNTPRFNSKFITDANLMALPTASAALKGSICRYNDEWRICNGNTWSTISV